MENKIILRKNDIEKIIAEKFETSVDNVIMSDGYSGCVAFIYITDADLPSKKAKYVNKNSFDESIANGWIYG